MKSTDLALHLRSMGIPADAYSIGEDRGESYCMVLEEAGWKVYYSERGNRNDEVAYADEDEACDDLLKRLMRDHVIQDRLASGH